MKITFIIPALTKGGAERVVSNLSNYLVENGNEVSIITLIKTDIEYEINRKVKIISVDTEYTNRSNLENNYSNIKKVLKYINDIKKEIKNNSKLKEILKDIDTDIYVAFLPKACFKILKYRNIAKKPIIISVRNDPKVEYKRIDNKIKMLNYYKKANGIVFQTEEAKMYFSKQIQEKSIIIPNPINEEFIIDDNMEPIKEKKIVSVGRLVEQKNQKLLIDAFIKIYNKYPDYKLYFYGDGYLKQDLENYVKMLHMEKEIFFLGNVDNIKEKIINASLFVMSSNYEGMPNSLMEAMSIGLPVISTDCPCGGPKFLIENNKNGKLVKVNDVEELANAIDEVLSNEEIAKRIGQNAKTIKEKLAPKVINQKWEDYIKQVERGKV